MDICVLDDDVKKLQNPTVRGKAKNQKNAVDKCFISIDTLYEAKAHYAR